MSNDNQIDLIKEIKNQEELEKFFIKLPVSIATGDFTSAQVLDVPDDLVITQDTIFKALATKKIEIRLNPPNSFSCMFKNSLISETYNIMSTTVHLGGYSLTVTIVNELDVTDISLTESFLKSIPKNTLHVYIIKKSVSVQHNLTDKLEDVINLIKYPTNHSEMCPKWLLPLYMTWIDVFSEGYVLIPFDTCWYNDFIHDSIPLDSVVVSPTSKSQFHTINDVIALKRLNNEI